MPERPIADAYRHALSLAAPKMAATAPGVMASGCWLDRDFYVLATAETEGADMLPTPVFYCATGDHNRRVSLRCLLGAELMPEDDLTALPIELAAPDRLIVTLRDEEHIFTLSSERRVARRPMIAPYKRRSPDLRYEIVVERDNLHLHDRQSGASRHLTDDGGNGLSYGRRTPSDDGEVQPFAPAGLWSPDARYFLTYRLDERDLPDTPVIGSGQTVSADAVVRRFKFPLAGAPVRTAMPVVIDTQTGEIIPLSLHPLLVTSFLPAFARQFGFADPTRVFIIETDVHSRAVSLSLFDLVTRERQMLLSEAVETGFIEPGGGELEKPANVAFIASEECFVWLSERDGYSHLYLYDVPSGTCVRPLTSGSWCVRELIAVDPGRRHIYFAAGGLEPDTDPARRSLCRVSLDGGAIEILLRHDGDVQIPSRSISAAGEDRLVRPDQVPCCISPDFTKAVVRLGSPTAGDAIVMLDLQSRDRVAVSPPARPAAHEPQLRMIRLDAADGRTPLFGLLAIPHDFSSDRRYPLINFVYPGPQARHQPQHHGATRACLARSLAALGFAVVMLDTRGTPGRGRAFQQGGYPSLQMPQLADHVHAIDALCAQYPFIDAERIGLLGESAGASAVVRLLCENPGRFRAGAAFCGNYDLALHTSGWIDRYAGGLAEHGAIDPPTAALIDRLQARLFLAAGDADRSVLAEQTVRLAQALAAAGKPFELFRLAEAGHDVLWTEAGALHRCWNFFVAALQGNAPPPVQIPNFSPAEIRAVRQLRIEESCW